MLNGVRIIELGQNLAAPFGASILADLGAEVVKVEKPGGEEGRKLGPPFVGDDPAWFHQVNRNKKSVVIDLKEDKGRTRFLQLLKSADVFIHNMRPGSLEKMGLGAQAMTALFPHLIYADVRAFGHVGPMAERPGYEMLMQAYGGIMSVTGGEDAPPTRAGPSIVDLTTGMWTAIGVLAALHRRQQTGHGSVVNTSLFESALALSAVHLANYSVAGKMPARTANGFAGLAPYGAFQAHDGSLIVGVANDNLFAKLCRLLGREEWISDSRFATNALRVQNKAVLNALVGGLIAEAGVATWLDRLERAGIPCAPIRTVPDLLDDEQVAALEIVRASPQDESLRLLLSPLWFDGQRPPVDMRVPRPGQNDPDFALEDLEDQSLPRST